MEDKATPEAGLTVPEGQEAGAGMGEVQAGFVDTQRSDPGGGETAPSSRKGPDAGGEKGEGETQDRQEAGERRARYRALVTGEFKDLFTADTQRIIDQRFKQTRRLQEALEAQRPVLERLTARYGTAQGDLAALAAAVEAEDARRAEAQREETLRRERQERLDRERRQSWEREAEALGESYPGFDLSAERQDPVFLAMVESGVPLKTAYEAVHLDAIKESVAREAALRQEQALTEDIRARGGRPPENGAGASNALTARPDPARMSPAQRADIARRAMRGEVITFR